MDEDLTPQVGVFVCRALLQRSPQPAIYDASGDQVYIRDLAFDCMIEPRLQQAPRYDGCIMMHG